MSYRDISKIIPTIILQIEKVVLNETKGQYICKNVTVELIEKQERLHVCLSAEQTPLCKVWLVVTSVLNSVVSFSLMLIFDE